MPVVQFDEIEGLTEFDPGTKKDGSKKDLEIIAFGDDTISMRDHVDENDPTSPTKAQLEIDILADMGTELWQLDSQAAREAAAGLDAGGVMVVRWGTTWFKDGDWRPANLEEKARLFTFRQDGTYIMEGIKGVTTVYHDEFLVDENGNPTPEDEWPALLCAGITDGECFDNQDFEDFAATLGGDKFLALVLLGSGDPYKRALSGYARVAEKNPHFVFLPFGTRVRPGKVTETFLRLAGQYA